MSELERMLAPWPGWTAVASALAGGCAGFAMLLLLRAARAAGQQILGTAGGCPSIGGRVGVVSRRLLPPRYLSRIERALRMAGEEPGEGVGRLVALQWVGLVIGVVAGLTLCRLGVSGWCGLLLAPMCGALPWVSLWRRGELRGRALVRALPACLDLLTVAVEAGLDFVPALVRVTERGRPGPLRDELGRVLQQLRLGLTREAALRSLAERLELPPFSRFVSAMVQADRSGVGLARVLRLQAQRLRVEQAHRAEAAALRAPIKLLFPLLLFIFPGTFLILLGPLAFELIVQAGLGAR